MTINGNQEASLALIEVRNQGQILMLYGLFTKVLGSQLAVK